MNTDSQWSKQEARFAFVTLSIATNVSILANEIDVKCVLHGQVRLAAVYQI